MTEGGGRRRGGHRGERGIRRLPNLKILYGQKIELPDPHVPGLRWSESVLIITGLIVLGTSFVLLTSPSTIQLYAAAALFALGNGLMWPSVVAVVSKVAEARLQGAVQGLAGSAGSLASVVGLVAGGIAYATIGAATFFISAGLAYLAFILACRLPWILSRQAEATP